MRGMALPKQGGQQVSSLRQDEDVLCDSEPDSISSTVGECTLNRYALSTVKKNWNT